MGFCPNTDPGFEQTQLLIFTTSGTTSGGSNPDGYCAGLFYVNQTLGTAILEYETSIEKENAFISQS